MLTSWDFVRQTEIYAPGFVGGREEEPYYPDVDAGLGLDVHGNRSFLGAPFWFDLLQKFVNVRGVAGRNVKMRKRNNDRGLCFVVLPLTGWSHSPLVKGSSLLIGLIHHA